MARRFGRFNKNQPRDKDGKWTSGGGSSKGSSKGGSKSKRKPLTPKKRRNRTLRRSAGWGGVVGGLVSVGNPAAILAGSAIGAGIGAGINRRRKSKSKG